MDGSLVVIFLLENVPANILNQTLVDISPLDQQITDLKQCSSGIVTDTIITTVSDKLNITLVPNWLPENRIKELPQYFNKTKDVLKEISAEKDAEVNDNSLDKALSDMESNTKVVEVPDNNLFSNEDMSDCDETTTMIDVVQQRDYETKDIPPSETEGLLSNVSMKAETNAFPEQLEALVAIFETLDNVTAQTCAGTVVAPQWVLTAANCVNVLPGFYNMPTNHTQQSHYTIIANADNPLIDGSVHNVTQILVHPDPDSGLGTVLGLIKRVHKALLRRKRLDKAPELALLKVEPEIDVAAPVMLESTYETNEQVMVYGWTLKKNDTRQNNTMVASSFPARVMSPEECQASQPAGEHIICLDIEGDDVAKKFNEMCSGGPIVTWRGGRARALAVARLGGRGPLRARPLRRHKSWLDAVAA